MGFTDSLKKIMGLEEVEEDEIVTEEELKREKQKIEKEVKTNKNSKNNTEEPSPTFGAQEGSSNSRAASYGGSSRRGSASGTGEKRFSVTGTNSLKLILIEPKSFDECSKLVDSLKSRKPIIINLEKLETEVARKIFDFLSGATYALDGKVQKIANNIFIFTPDNVSVAAQQSQDPVDPDDVSRWR